MTEPFPAVMIAALLFCAAPPAGDLARLTAKAEKGDTLAQCELGRRYAAGDGVTKDAAAAVRWYRKAALAGDQTAQYNLGLAAAQGRGMTKDEAAAATWFRLAAEQGHPQAQLALGELYESGKG